MAIDWSTFGVDLHLSLAEASSGESAGRRAALEQALRQAIRSGRLPPQTRLPSTRALATDLEIARGTVTAAYDQLIAEGFLAAQAGSGTVVATLAPAPPERQPAEQGVQEPHRWRYDLRPGTPDVTSFPQAAWLRALRQVLSAPPATVIGYGDPRGRPELRTALAGYLGRVRGVVADPDRIVITSGGVQALSLLASVTGARTTAPMAMEDPGLTFHREVVQRAGPAVVPIEVDEAGARTDLLEDGQLGEVSALVLTPAHQYPTGVTLSPARRLAAVRWAAAAHALVIEDDYDGEFRYDRQPVGALQGMAPENVAHMGSVSKSLGPALRLGWLVLPAHLVEPVVELKRYTDLHTESIGQLALAHLISTHGYDRHVRSCRQRYRHRRDLLVQRLTAGGHHGLVLRGIAAGLQAWVHLEGQAPTERRVLATATRRGLAVSGLGECWHDPEADHPQGIVVGFGTPSQSGYPGAIQLLSEVLTSSGVGSS